MNYALRILLLDDDGFMVEMLADMIAGLGYGNVHAETDARSALRALPVFKPDLLVCDLSMPDMDGIEFLRTVAEGGFDGGVILLSGMDSGILRAAETLATAQGLTIVGACSKPLSRAALAGLLDAAGGMAGGSAAAAPHGSGK